MKAEALDKVANSKQFYFPERQRRSCHVLVWHRPLQQGIDDHEAGKVLERTRIERRKTNQIQRNFTLHWFLNNIIYQSWKNLNNGCFKLRDLIIRARESIHDFSSFCLSDALVQLLYLLLAAEEHWGAVVDGPGLEVKDVRAAVGAAAAWNTN